MECQINNMISKIYKSNYPIWKAGTLKNKTKEEIEKDFIKQNSYKRKPDNSLTNLEKRKRKLQKRFKKLNPNLFNK